jgi:diguanylate cyclase (GGDEF)-like protein/PAS domain S-box-containing protein
MLTQAAMDNQTLFDIIDNLESGLYFVNKDRKITYWNKGAEKISGYTAEEVIGRYCSDNLLNHVDKTGICLCKTTCPLAATILDGRQRKAEVFLHHKQGHRVPISVRSSTITNEAGEVLGGVEMFTDLSDQYATNARIEELERLALLDHLTQLANRNYVERELDARFYEMKRLAVPFGLLFMDIDHFKRINDDYGHDVGDLVLKFVSKTFVANSRNFDLYGRWGGEEFIGIIRNIQKEALVQHGERLRVLVGQSFLVHKEIKINVTISIGATTARPDDTADSIIKRADEMLFFSKKRGRNVLTFG